MAEMLVVMAIITILAAALAIVLPRIRTRAMREAAGADIHLITMALEEHFEDRGYYPRAPYKGNPDKTVEKADYILFMTLTNPDYSPSDCDDPNNPGGAVTGDGWGRARDDWEFIRGDSAEEEALLDPWGVPYYYIAHYDYLQGVRVDDPTEDASSLPSNVAMYYGATPRPDDYAPSKTVPPTDYFGPPPKLEEFYNARSFQLHSKGPDQLTDIADGDIEHVDPCDRGTDPDDVNNYGGVYVDE
jgi:type II secretory pathway pseudopilin PulG